MEIAIKSARETCQAAEMAKRAYNKHVRPVSFQPGVVVSVYSPRKVKGKFPKWHRLYSTECKISKKLSDVSKKLSDVSYVVYDLCGKRNRIVHVDKLKLLSSCVENTVNGTISVTDDD
jgi:hypothetical protein